MTETPKRTRDHAAEQDAAQDAARDAARDAAGRQHLRVFAITVLAIAAFIVVLNRLTFRALTTPRYNTIAQMISGWDRAYKPLLYDEVRPQVVAVGASWVRDAFDPEPVEKLLGKRFFNFGVSGGRPYESQRFLQSGLAAHVPEHVVLNLNSFEDTLDAFRTKFGFSEKLLRVHEDGTPNRWVAVHRFVALNLSGAAIGYNVAVLRAAARRAAGEDIEQIMPSYDHFDYTRWRPALGALRMRMVDGADLSEEELPPRPKQKDEEPGRFGTLVEVLDMLCAQGIAVHAYYTPHHMLTRACVPTIEREMKAYDVLKAWQQRCDAPVSYHVFEYPNAFTLEAALSPRDESRYYRSDRHPRPTIGTLMMARMMDKPFPPGAPPDDTDFGTDLLAVPEQQAREWLTARKARCDGAWAEGELEKTRRVAERY